MTADILVIQVLSTSIAARIAYSYGYDAKDPDEQIFIQRLVRRSFIAQAAKVEPLRDVARAADAIKDVFGGRRNIVPTIVCWPPWRSYCRTLVRPAPKFRFKTSLKWCRT